MAHKIQLADSVFLEEVDAALGIYYIEIGTNVENLDPVVCEFSEPWTTNPCVFKNIYEP